MSTLLRDYANESSARHASISEAAWSSVRATFPRPHQTSPERHALRVRAARYGREFFNGAPRAAVAHRWARWIDYMADMIEGIQRIEAKLKIYPVAA